MTPEKLQRIKYIISDFVATNVAWFIFNLIRYYTLPYNFGIISLGTYLSMPMVIIGQMVFPLLMVALYGLSGYYNNVLFKSRVDEAINTFGISLIGSVIIFFIALFNDAIDDRLKNYEMVIILWALIGIITYIPRLILTIKLNKRIRNRKIKFNTLIIGCSDKAIVLADELVNRYPNMGFNVVGFINDKSNTIETNCELPVYNLEDLEYIVADNNIRSFIIVQEGKDVQRTVSLINRLFPYGKSIFITPDAMHYITMRPRTQMVSGEVLIDVSKSHIAPSTQNIKRISDIIVSLITLVIISPLMGCIAWCVKRSSPGPVIYKQERVGLHQKKFKILKFRTMYIDSEKDGPALSSDNDLRITPIGKILRKYRLDELPQFWNVVKGDMSIVGPRPEREFYLKQIIGNAPYYSLLQQVRPGITSWGMVKYGYASTVEQMIERAKFDLLYIDNVSMIVDIKILLYTIETVITGKGV